MLKKVNVVHYWGGSPAVPNSKWLRTLKLIEKCSEEGWNNWLILSKQSEDYTLIKPFLDAGCQIIYQPRSKGNFDLFSVYRNFFLLRRIRCTLFHCNNDHTSPIIAAKLAGVPIRIWSKLAMSSFYELGIAPKGLHKLMPSLRLTTLLANKVLTISHAVKAELGSQVGFEGKMAVVDAPVPVYEYTSATSARIREEFKLSPDDIVITAVGHSVEVKGWDVAIKAFRLIVVKYPNAKLLFVGKHTSEGFHQKLCALIKDHDLSSNIIFTGIRRDIPDILKASDIFIFPSRSEGVGGALIESRAAGLPCVATNTGGIPEVIEDGVNGFLFQRDNPEQLAEKVNQLISTPELRSQFSASAVQGLDKYKIETYVDNVFLHYQTLLKSEQM